MRVERIGVGEFKSILKVAKLRAGHGGPRVRSIHMVPETVEPGDLSDPANGIHGCRSCRPDGGDDDDRGQTGREVGFYRSLQGGIASLRVNMDAGGVRKSGTLRVRDFAIVGDSVVADVLSDPSSAAALGQHQHDVKRQIVFRRLRAPFIAGGGKFQLDDAYVNGPELGATLRGTIDFNARKLDLGGTYVPLYGLNSALGAVPVLGRVLVGRQGEGVVGITFAIKGKLDDPTVLVNPMSVMTPGIFRQIFDFNSGVPQGTTSAGTETWGENTSTERSRKKRRLRPLQNARERRGLN